MDIVEQFRTNTRRVHVWIFLGLSMLLSTVTSILLVLHVTSDLRLLFAGGYGAIMAMTTFIAFIIPSVDTGLNVRNLLNVVKRLQRKYLIFVVMYLWFGIGFYTLYPLLHISSTFDIFPSIYTGLVAGTLCFCLAAQFILLNYTLVGPAKLSKEDLEKVKEMIEKDIDEFDPEEYKERDIEDLEDYKERIEEEKDRLD